MEAFALPVVVVTAVFADEIVRVIGGPGFADAAPVLQLILAIGVSYLNGVYGNALVALGRQSALLRLSVIVLAANLAINLVLIPPLGAKGAAIAVVATEVLAFFAVRRLYGRHAGALPSPPHGRILLAGLGLLAAVAIRALAGGLPDLLLIAVGGAAALAAYGTLLVSLRAVPEPIAALLAPRWNLFPRAPRPMKLSAVLAVRNEEPMLEACLRLLEFCDEIVVVIDDRTTDRTEEIARRHTDRVFVEPFVDFARQKNSAIARARGEWLLIVDADERITPALATEIEGAIAGDPPSGRSDRDHQPLLRDPHAPRRLVRVPHAADPPRQATYPGRSTRPSTSRRSASAGCARACGTSRIAGSRTTWPRRSSSAASSPRELHEAGAPTRHGPPARLRDGPRIRFPDGPPPRLQGRHGRASSSRSTSRSRCSA